MLYYFEKLCNTDRLTQEIEDSAITVAIDYIYTVSSPATTNVYMKAPLSESESSTLSSLVTAHINTPPDDAPVTQPVQIQSQPMVLVSSDRTKRHASPSIITINPGESAESQFQLPEELYIQGGSIVTANAEVGDWITASVKDVDSIIPEAYRAALCENWPIVSTYVVKEWVSGSNTRQMSTAPFSSKVAAGLYMCMTYHATNEGVARKLGCNYSFVKKLS